jgi:hypothetical protein
MYFELIKNPVRILGVAALLLTQSVSADEGGVPFWFSGQYSSLSAVPATPGWSVALQGYYYNGGSSKTFTKGDSLTVDIESQTPLLIAQPSYAPKTKIFGGQAMIGLAVGYGENTTEAKLSVSPDGTEYNASDSITGFTDLYPIASLAWNKGVNNWMTYVTGDIPVGDYNASRLANIGIGHAAIDAGGGYTYLNETSGLEFSALAGLTYNWENSDTDYQNGVDSHIDWAVSQFLSANWEVGIAGYLYYQLTGDSGSGAKLGSFESKVASIGPEVGYLFNVNGLDAYANVRGYWEFWSEHRVEGYSLFATLSIPLGPDSSKTAAN